LCVNLTTIFKNKENRSFTITQSFKNVTEIVECTSGSQALEHILRIYNDSLTKIRDSFSTLISDTPKECGEVIYRGANYPYVGLNVKLANVHIDARLAFGVALEPGLYGTTVTRPDLFGAYFREQIDLLIEHHKVPVVVGISNYPIPVPFALDPNSLEMNHDHLPALKLDVTLPALSRVNDDVANSVYQPTAGQELPLSLFSAERVDYSLHRLHHYTGTATEHFQQFILLTNYPRYVNEFIAFAQEELSKESGYTAFVEPGDYITHHHTQSSAPEGERLSNLPQMPAYHLKRADGQGITFINIGVGPSNAKTITDHLAVLRPHCWLMLGHCGGLRRSQLLGDYVLAHAYVRDDHVLDEDLPLAVPIPAIAEVQVALQEAVANITGLRGLEMKTRMRTGTVFTTDNRNWELRSRELFPLFQQTRTIAVDMESATVAGNGFRFRVPYGTLLCVSDKPIHGEIKLRGMANNFYRDRIQQHLKVGLETIRLLREGGVKSLHSRKLRGFDEPPFR
jgi:AMP nucleosidase